jgi:hypothetical protein
MLISSAMGAATGVAGASFGCTGSWMTLDDLDGAGGRAGGTLASISSGKPLGVTYRKCNDPWLVASDIRDDPNFRSSRFTFRARAWKLANEKARELGWIVILLLLQFRHQSGPETCFLGRRSFA